MEKQGLLKTEIPNIYVKTRKVRIICRMCKHRFITHHKLEYCSMCKIKSQLK